MDGKNYCFYHRIPKSYSVLGQVIRSTAGGYLHMLKTPTTWHIFSNAVRLWSTKKLINNSFKFKIFLLDSSPYSLEKHIILKCFHKAVVLSSSTCYNIFPAYSELNSLIAWVKKKFQLQLKCDHKKNTFNPCHIRESLF